MEKERIRHREKSFLTGKKRMEKLKVLMKYAGISVFEYFPDADRLVLYDEQLKEERRMQPFLGRLEELCTVYPEQRKTAWISDRKHPGNRRTESAGKRSLPDGPPGCTATGGR